MNIPWAELSLVGGLGAVGGVVQCAMNGFHVPRRDKANGTWHFGSIGSIVAGAIAAAVVWCLYGPLASFNVAGSGHFEANLPLLQLASSVLVGLSGGEVLRLESQKRILGIEKEQMAKAKNELAEALKICVEGESDDQERET